MFLRPGDQKPPLSEDIQVKRTKEFCPKPNFNDRKVSLYYKVGYYSVISYILNLIHLSVSFFLVFVFCKIELSGILFKSPNPQDWRLEVPTRNPAVGAGVRACRAPTAGPPGRTLGKQRPRGGSCCPGA